MTALRDGTPAGTRRAWQRRDPAAGTPLRIALLSSFTVDPLLPHLGLPLHEAGLAPEFLVGPFNQIAQECLRPDSATARFAPDVLLVAVRPEDRPAAGDGDPEGAPGRLATLALDAARRWGALLLWVLPALPEERPHGAGDAGDPLGAVARATAPREAVRARLAREPGARVVDLEEAVRAVGARHAHHAALLAFARIPYTEETFSALGGAAARVLLARYGQGCQGVLIDLDTLLPGPGTGGGDGDGGAGAGQPDGADEGAALAGLLERLPPYRPVAFRTDGTADSAWGAVAERAPRLARVPARWLGGAPAADHLARFAADTGLPPGRIAVLAGQSGDGGGARWPAGTLLVDRGPEAGPPWPALAATGVLDHVPPVTSAPGPPPGTAPGPTPAAPPAPGLDDFLRGLGVTARVDRIDSGPAHPEHEVADRAHDFTLALDPAPGQYLRAAGRSLLSARVRDRHGDYGTSAVIGVRESGPVWVVELFSLSCVVMGKGVEDILLDDLAERAAAGGARALEFHYRDTGRNRPALDFLRRAAGPRPGRDGHPLEIRAVPEGPGLTGPAVPEGPGLTGPAVPEGPG
ncbi:hypothetical protein [Streptomyces sp. NPDC001985]|uniref:hypothetical protein n=1 Tax=Streptomyces sp. NPDC001985 TaxID=3154406 RepID=UPI00332A0EA8